MNMTSEEKSYLAGIVDGEGSIMLIRFNKKKFPAPCISISSTSLELLEWIKNKVGFGVISEKKNYNLEKHHNSFTYAVRYNNALEMISVIEPYLVIKEKKHRAQMLLRDYKKFTVRNGRYTKDQLIAKNEFLDAFYKI